MPETVWLNGRFLTREEARLSAFDAAFQHAVGLFETMLACEGRIFRVESHMARLARSARELGLSDALRTAPLAEAAQNAVDYSELARNDGRARVRLTITGGDLQLLGARPPGQPTGLEPSVLIHVQPAMRYPDEMFSRGVSAIIAEEKANPFDPTAGHKTINYWWRLRALQRAAVAGAGEAIILQITNHVCGGCVSNLFVVRDGRLLTPIARGEETGGSGGVGTSARNGGAPGHGIALPSPVLPGVTRAAVIEFAGERKLPVEQRMLTITDLLDADELFLTNASWGILPVVRIERKEIGRGSAAGTPGEITLDLRRRWLRALKDEP